MSDGFQQYAENFLPLDEVREQDEIRDSDDAATKFTHYWSQAYDGLRYIDHDLGQNMGLFEKFKKNALEIIEKVEKEKDADNLIDENALRRLKKTIASYELEFEQTDISGIKDALKISEEIVLDHLKKQQKEVDVDRLILDKAIGGLETIEKQKATIATYEQTIDEQRETIDGQKKTIEHLSYQQTYPDYQEAINEQKKTIAQQEEILANHKKTPSEWRKTYSGWKKTPDGWKKTDLRDEVIMLQDEAITDGEQINTDQENTIAKQKEMIKDKDNTISQLKKQLADLVKADKSKPSLRKSKRTAEVANADKASANTPPNKDSRVDYSGLNLTFATEVYFFDRDIFSSDISVNGLNYLQDSVVTMSKGQEKSSFLTKFSASVRNATPGVVGGDLDSLIFTWQDLNEAGPGFYEVNNHAFNDYLQEQKWKLVNGMVPGVKLNGELGTKVIFFHKADRALAREGFHRATPTK